MPSRDFLIDEWTITGGTPLDISNGGRAFILIAASSDVTLRVYRNETEAGRAIDAPAGIVIPVREGFDRIRLESATTQTVKLGISQDPLALQALTPDVNVATVTGEALTDAADQTVTGGASAQVAAASSGRRAVLVQSIAANANNVRVGTSSVSATRGIELQPGQSVTLETVDAVHVHAITSNADVAVVEIG